MTFRDSNVYDVEVKIGKLVLVLRKVHIIEYVLLYDDALDTETTYDEHFYSIVYNSDEGEVNEEIDEAMYYRYLNYKWVSSLVDKNDLHNELQYSPDLPFYKQFISEETKQFFNL